MTDLKFTLTLEGDAAGLDDIVRRLADGLNVQSIAKEVAPKGSVAALSAKYGVSAGRVAEQQQATKPVDEDGPDIDGPPTHKVVDQPRPGTAAALLSDPTQPGQAHLAEEASEGLNEAEEAEGDPAEVVDIVVDPDNLTGELYDLAQTMEGRMETDGIQMVDKKRGKAGETVGFMYDASDASVICNATIVKTWRGKALIVDKDGEGHIVSGKELTSAAEEADTATETADTATDQADIATDQADIAPADADTVRQLYTEVNNLVSQQRAVQIMIDVAGKKKLGEFTDEELASAAAMLRHELQGFEAAE